MSRFEIWLRGCLISLVASPRLSRTIGIPAERDRTPSPLMGEGWDEGDTPHLSPLPQGERMPMSQQKNALSREVKELIKQAL